MGLVGVDTGGTFTDLVCYEDGELRLAKVPTTRPDTSRGVLNGLRRLQPRPGFEMAVGTTVGTNAFLERRGARTALVTTFGFADLLELGRGTRPELYALVPHKPPALIPRADCHELEERVSAAGEVLQPARGIEELADRLVGYESVAVCLLFSFLRPEHEEQVGEALRRRGLAVSLSSRVSPELREFERASTTVLNAYLQPVLRGYLAELEQAAAGVGARRLFVVHSAGAVMSAGEAIEQAAAAVLSGPAAGVHGAFEVARVAGFSRILTLDMGGTSTDVSLCPGCIQYSSEGDLEGTPVRQLMIDVHTVGAGGGSIARLDAGGGLQVGPESAGSVPGPAAYGQGDRPTVTDANLVLGRLPLELAGGAVRLDPERSRQALGGLGYPSPEEAALGVLRLAEARMERALRVISLERGHDPRDFTLVPFGGAGPLHAASLAEKLGMRRVLVPLYPGVLSALGALVAPWMREFAVSRRFRLGPDWAGQAEPVFVELAARARAAMGGRLRCRRLVDLRYRGQGFELTLPARGDLERAFHRAHRTRYGYGRPGFEVEVVALRLRAERTRERPDLGGPTPSDPARNASGPTATPSDLTAHACDPTANLADLPATEPIPSARQPAYGHGLVGVFARDLLTPGACLRGPALITQLDCTTWLPPGWAARVDPHRNLLLEPA